MILSLTSISITLMVLIGFISVVQDQLMHVSLMMVYIHKPD